MLFHLPLDIRWNPEFVLNELLRRGIEATIAGQEVRVVLSSIRSMAWRDRHRDHIELRRARGLPDRPHLAIGHHPNRFLRNIELERDVFSAPLSDSTLILAQASILDLGGILLDDLDTEFEIALAHCRNAVALQQYRTRIERSRTEKEDHLSVCDFDAAAHARSNELVIWEELETFLLHGAT